MATIVPKKYWLSILLNVLACGCLFCCRSWADVTCAPTTLIGNQSRTDMKHRGPGLQSVSLNQTSVTDMLNWSNPATISRTSNSPIDPRENQAFTMKGDLWRVKIEGNDCDFHLELSAPGDSSGADRVIVEIPQGSNFVQIRDSLIQALIAAGEGDLRHRTTIDLSQSIPIQVTGFAFFDAFHYSRANPKRGHGHGTAMVGTIWELHPVWQLVLLTGPQPLLVAGVPATGPGPFSDPQNISDFTVAKSFFEKLENARSIKATFDLNLGVHSSIHPLKSDCEMHVVGKAVGPDLGWPSAVVVEPPNLCQFDPEGNETQDTSSWLSVFDDLSGKQCKVTGFPRIFTEHATGAAGASNPNHVFEIHPALLINCGDQNISFDNFLKVFPGMRAISPSTTSSCITERKLEVRFNKDTQQYEFRESGGRCGNFAVIEVEAINPKWVYSVGGGHSAIARVSPDGGTTVTLKLYTLSPSSIDSWLAAVATQTSGLASPKLLHGLFTYDYYSIERVVHPRGKDWQAISDWTPVPFPLALVIFGEADAAPWGEE